MRRSRALLDPIRRRLVLSWREDDQIAFARDDAKVAIIESHNPSAVPFRTGDHGGIGVTERQLRMPASTPVLGHEPIGGVREHQNRATFPHLTDSYRPIRNLTEPREYWPILGPLARVDFVIHSNP
jgi:hypothetical protein